MDLLAASGPARVQSSSERNDAEAMTRRCRALQQSLGLAVALSNPFAPQGRACRRVLLGKGSHAKVWRLETATSTFVAVKEVMLVNPSCADAAMREIRLLQSLAAASGSCIVRMSGAWLDPSRGVAEVVLEYCPAGSLADWLALRRGGGDCSSGVSSCSFQPAKANTEADAEASAVLDLARPLLTALAFLHAQGWCHGDFKPSNILLRLGSPTTGVEDATPEASALRQANPWGAGALVPVLCDFGLATKVPPPILARQGDGSSSSDGGGGCFRSRDGVGCSVVDVGSTRVPCGSLQYCPPEALATQASGGATADVWAAGLVCWEVLDDGLHPLSHGASTDNEGASEAFTQIGAGPARVVREGPDFWRTSEAIDALPERARMRLVQARRGAKVSEGAPEGGAASSNLEYSSASTPALDKTKLCTPAVLLWGLIGRCLEQAPDKRPTAAELLVLV